MDEIFNNKLEYRMGYIKKASIDEINEERICIIIYFEIYNENLFGNGEIYNGVFARYRKLEKEVLKTIINETKKQVEVGVLPYLSKNSFYGDMYNINQEEVQEIVSPLEIISLEEAGLQNSIKFNRIKNSIKFALRRLRDRKIYLLEQSMYLTVSLLQNIYMNPNKMLFCL